MHDLYSIRIRGTNASYEAHFDCSFHLPIYGARTNYYDSSINDLGGPGVRENDSGNPAFIILNDEPVLLTLWVGGGGGSGTPITSFKSEINEIMSSLGYALTEIDLLNFDTIPLEMR